MSLKRTSAIKEELRKAAAERQEVYDKLSLEEKLAKLPPEPHCQKQRSKLMTQLENKSKRPLSKQSEEIEVPMKAKERKSKESRGE